MPGPAIYCAALCIIAKGRASGPSYSSVLLPTHLHLPTRAMPLGPSFGEIHPARANNKSDQQGSRCVGGISRVLGSRHEERWAAISGPQRHFRELATALSRIVASYQGVSFVPSATGMGALDAGVWLFPFFPKQNTLSFTASHRCTREIIRSWPHAPRLNENFPC